MRFADTEGCLEYGLPTCDSRDSRQTSSESFGALFLFNSAFIRKLAVIEYLHVVCHHAT